MVLFISFIAYDTGVFFQSQVCTKSHI